MNFKEVKQIRFSQTTVKKHFNISGGKISINAKAFQTWSEFNSKVCPIEVVQLPGDVYISLDNRRLYNFKRQYPTEKIAISLKLGHARIPDEILDQERFRFWIFWEGNYNDIQGVYLAEVDPLNYITAVRSRCCFQGSDFPIDGSLNTPKVTDVPAKYSSYRTITVRSRGSQPIALNELKKRIENLGTDQVYFGKDGRRSTFICHPQFAEIMKRSIDQFRILEFTFYAEAVANEHRQDDIPYDSDEEIRTMTNWNMEEELSDRWEIFQNKKFQQSKK